MKTVVCSHGFGVRADGRGMFTDIATSMPQYNFVMFDYNKIHDNGDIEVVPLDEQAQKLQQIINDQPDEVIVLAHSQGCVIAGLIDPDRVKKFILLAPPVIMNMQRLIDRFKDRPGAELDLNGVSKLPRRDGSSTLITKQYIDSIADIDTLETYKQLASNKNTIIVRATEDEVVGKTEFGGVTNARVIDIAAGHDFSGDARAMLINVLQDEL